MGVFKQSHLVILHFCPIAHSYKSRSINPDSISQDNPSSINQLLVKFTRHDGKGIEI